MNRVQWISPDWPAPGSVRAAATLRTGGVSVGAYESLNLGSHVDDDPAAVAANRSRVRQALDLPSEPLWLNQVHGSTVLDSRAAVAHGQAPTADASIAFAPGIVCAVLTADCLPVLICDREGTRVAAVHAGWRGLASGVIAATVAALEIAPVDLMAWLGPAIEPEAFEVGADVRERFLQVDATNAAAFTENMRGRWQADLYRLARSELQRLGVEAVYGGGYRCFGDAERFFSYRRDGQTGRMATMVWIEPEGPTG